MFYTQVPKNLLLYIAIIIIDNNGFLYSSKKIIKIMLKNQDHNFKHAYFH